MTSAISIRNVSKLFGKQKALDGVSFEIPAGTVFGLLGPNGAGKTTLFSIVANFLKPTGGSVSVLGIDVGRIGELRGRLTILPQDALFQANVPVREQLEFFARLNGLDRAAATEEATRVLTMVGLLDAQKKNARALSHGMTKRLGIAQAFMGKPEVIVLDEPTAGLDPNQIRQVRDLIRGMAGQKTVLLSTHILPEVESTCGRVLIIHRGRLVGEGEPGRLRIAGEGGQSLTIEGRGERARFEQVLGAVPGVRALSDVTVLQPDPPLVRIKLETDAGDVAEAVFKAIAAAGLTLRELRREATSLEDVFAKLTTRDVAAEEPAAPAPEPESDAKATGTTP
jgi:ABC-2 type transport system ATP-binding protein